MATGRAGEVIPVRGRKDMRAWFAVHTNARKERLATRLLLDQGIDVFWPNYLAQIRYGKRRGYELRSWFSRYLFVAEGPFFDPGKVNATMGVSKMVYIGDRLLTIPFDVIMELKSLADPRGTIPAARCAPPNMVEIKGDNFLECLLCLGGFKTRVWARGLMATVKAA